MATLDELKAKLQAIIDEYKLVSKEKTLIFTAATKAKAKIEPKIPDTNRHAVVAYYASHFCTLVWKFCEQNNEFARKKITAEQRNANQQALYNQIRTLLGNARPAFRDVIAKEETAHTEKQQDWPDNRKTKVLTEVSYMEKKYPDTDALIAAMQAEFDALAVGRICNCSFCSANQLPAPVPMKVGDTIVFAAAFQQTKSGKDFFDQSIAEIKAEPVTIRPEDLAGYLADIAKIAAFLTANSSATISIEVGSTSNSQEPESIDKIKTLISVRANKVKADFIAGGIPASKIEVIELAPNQPNLNIKVIIK